MADFYFGSTNPDLASNYSQFGGGNGTSILNNDATLVLTVPAGGITITELARGMDSATGQAGTTVAIGVYDVTGSPANPPLLGSATITSRSDNAGYVWHSVTGLSINVDAGKVIAIGSALPTTAVWHTRGAEISDAGAATTTLPSPWSGTGLARVIPLRAGYSLNTPPATLYDINTTNTLRVGQTGNTISTGGIGTLTSVTVGGKAVTNLSAPSGDGTFDMPSFSDGVAYTLLGSKTATATDGTNSANQTVTLNPPVGYEYVTLSGTLNTTNTGVLYNLSPAAAVTDQIVYPIGLLIDAQGNVEGDAGVYTLWHIDATDNVTRSYTLTLATSGGSNGNATSTGMVVTVSIGAGTPRGNAGAVSTGVQSSFSIGSGIVRGFASAVSAGIAPVFSIGTGYASGQGSGLPQIPEKTINSPISLSTFKNIFKSVSRKLYTKREK
ncbi:hypothetical protein EKK58_12370 [Candidatus Dependentiae bacterium]|nr:MAG: hypothetical protein EKK58_12370 [Candidatus Dependentiae bacterium]